MKIKKVDIWHSDSEVLEELTTDATGSIYFPKLKIPKNEDNYVITAFVGTGNSSSSNANDYLGMAIQLHKNSKDLVCNVMLSGALQLYTFPGFWDTLTYDSLIVSFQFGSDTLVRLGKHYFQVGGYPNQNYPVDFFSIENGTKQFLQTINYTSDFIPDCSDETYVIPDSTFISVCTQQIIF